MSLEAYEILQKLGQGAFGVVHLVRRRETKKKVCFLELHLLLLYLCPSFSFVVESGVLTTIRLAVADAEKYVVKEIDISHVKERQAAMLEAQLLSQLDHPNIVKCRESFQSALGTELYIVMQFCDGGDLHQRIDKQTKLGKLFPENLVMDWFVQIALALQYLHGQNILHRDLKTQNIFLTKRNIIKVGDLGIARVLNDSFDMAQTTVGTPYYMSPELFSNEPYNFKSDIWSMGCCMYEIATLQQAFNARSLTSLMAKIHGGQVAPLASVFSSELNEMILSMLSKEPADRPTVVDMLTRPHVKQHMKRFVEETVKHKKDKRASSSGEAHAKTSRSASLCSNGDSSSATSLSASTESRSSARDTAARRANMEARERRRQRRTDRGQQRGQVQAVSSPALVRKDESKNRYDLVESDEDEAKAAGSHDLETEVDKMLASVTTQLSLVRPRDQGAAPPSPRGAYPLPKKRMESLARAIEASSSRQVVERLERLLTRGGGSELSEATLATELGDVYERLRPEVHQYVMLWGGMHRLPRA